MARINPGMMMIDGGYGKTSTAINESVNMFQSLKSKLGRE
jgi:hypothetical protein